MAPAHKKMTMFRAKRNKHKFRKRQFRSLPDKVKYGLTKTVNHGGFYAFKEKTVARINLAATAGPAEAPNTVSSCLGGFNTANGMTHSLNGTIPMTNNAYCNRQYRSYSELFEYWRITGVKVKIIPNADTKTISAVPASRQVPTLWWYTDSNRGKQTPLNIDVVQRKARTKFRRLDRVRTIFHKPSITKLIVKDATAALAFANESYVPKIGSNDWIPTSSTSGYEPGLTEYAGLHLGLLMPSTAPDTVFPYSIVITTYYEFKGNK